MEDEQEGAEIKPTSSSPKTEFEIAIQNTSIEDLETAIDPLVITELKSQVDKSGILVLGEMHGVKENPEVIYTLMKRLNIKSLGLEWDKGLTEMVDEYLATGKLDYEKIAKSPDGRITAGHFALLKRLHDEGRLEKLICFDKEFRNWDSWGERDAAMASNVLSELDSKPSLIVAGNLHTLTSPVEIEGQLQHPMGELIKKAAPDAPTATIDYLSGSYYNIGIEEFPDQKKLDSKPNLKKTKDSIYTFEIPEAHPAVVPNTELQKHSATFNEALKKAKDATQKRTALF